MKTNLFAVGAFAAALALPLAAGAQQSAYPQQNQYPAAQPQGQPGMPSQATIQRRWTRRLSRLNLSGDQQQRIQTLITQFSQAHPEGSQRVPGAGRELRRQIMGVLTNDQQNQLHQEMQARHAQMRQYRDQQYQGQPNQGQPPNQGQQPQGQPPYQGQPPQQGQPPA
jgi:hypothetical protein